MTEREKRWAQVLQFMGETKAQIDELQSKLAALKREAARFSELRADLERKKRSKAGVTYTDDECAVAREVIAKINEHAGTAIRAETSPGQLTAEGRAVVARLRKGATSWEMRLIAWHKCPDFAGEKGIGRKYCKPSTLYIDKHFDTYLDEAALAYAEAENVPVAVARRGQERKREQVPIAELVKEAVK